MSSPPSADPASADALAQVYGVIGPLYRRAVRRIEDRDGLPMGERAVLELLEATGGQPVPAIADRLALSRQFVQRTVDAAVGDGLVELQPNPAHRRSSIIALTPAGAARIAQVRRAEQDALREAAADLRQADVDACLRVLVHLHRHLLTDG